MGAIIAAAVIAGAGTVYASSQASKASEKASAALGGMKSPNLKELPNPETVDWKDIARQAPQINANNLDHIFGLGNRVNQFNTNQFLRGANKIQPYFTQLQEQIGRNAMSYSKGELPGDVVGSIGRAAASQGFRNGIGGGSRGGGFNTALGGLNLRNLGLTSLQLSQQGTQMGMQANQNAASMVPGLFDPSSMFVTPGMGISAQFQNAGIINDWNRANTGIINAERTGNAELANSVLQAQTGMAYQNSLQQAQAVQSASSTASGLVGAGYFGGGQGANAGNNIFASGGGGGGAGAPAGYSSGNMFAQPNSWQANAMGGSRTTLY